MVDKIKILAIDDEVTTLRLLKRIIEKNEQYEVLTAESGMKAFEILNKEKVQIIISDQRMPEISGSSLLSVVTVRYPKIVKILLTGYSDMEATKEAINKGKIFSFLTKPINTKELMNTLEKACEQYQAQGEKFTLDEDTPEWRESHYIGSYRILRKIGEGGMGSVYRAYDEKAKKTVAIKLLKDKCKNPLQIERFKRESFTCELVHHPGIVKIYDKGEDRGRLYYVMEFLDGDSLHELLEKRKLSLAESCQIGIGILRIIRAFHSKGIVHRDLKPNNVFILKGDESFEQRIKILDFGIAKIEGHAQITQSGTVEGCVEFVAPESLNGFSKAGKAADVYSFGIIFYNMLFSNLPYEGKNIGEIIRHKVSAEIELPPAAASLPKEIAKLLSCMILRDEKERISDTLAIEKELHNFCRC